MLLGNLQEAARVAGYRIHSQLCFGRLFCPVPTDQAGIHTPSQLKCSPALSPVCWFQPLFLRSAAVPCQH